MRARALVPRSVAAQLIGVSDRTIRNWVNRGEEAETKLEGGGRLTKEERRYYEFLQGEIEKIRPALAGYLGEADHQ